MCITFIQREFFFSGLGVGLAVGGMWLAHRAVGSAVWGRQYVAIEAVLLAAVVVLLILAVAIGKNGGKWGKGDAARTVFSGTTNYSLAYGALAAAAAAIVLGIIAPACALYLLWGRHRAAVCVGGILHHASDVSVPGSGNRRY